MVVNIVRYVPNTQSVRSVMLHHSFVTVEVVISCSDCFCVGGPNSKLRKHEPRRKDLVKTFLLNCHRSSHSHVALFFLTVGQYENIGEMMVMVIPCLLLLLLCLASSHRPVTKTFSKQNKNKRPSAQKTNFDRSAQAQEPNPSKNISSDPSSKRNVR